MSSSDQLVLVTVGTTKFDALIRGVDKVSFLEKLVEHGFNSVLIQQGQGDYSVQHISPSPVSGIRVRVENYLSNLASDIARASLVICHGGAGSIFESLTFKVPLVVVPNPVLMENHQVELAQLLEERNHIVSCTADTVEQAVDTIQSRNLDPYVAGEAGKIAEAISALFP